MEQEPTKLYRVREFPRPAGVTARALHHYEGLNRMWQDQQYWPAPQRERHAIEPEIQEFIMKSMRAK